MPAYTSRANLYKPGGGSSGVIPDEPLDVDKLNDNADKIDAALGFKVCTSTTRPTSPFDGQSIYETNTQKIKVFIEAQDDWVDGVVLPATPTVDNLSGATTTGKALMKASSAAGARTTLEIPRIYVQSGAMVAGTPTNSLRFWG